MEMQLYMNAQLITQLYISRLSQTQIQNAVYVYYPKGPLRAQIHSFGRLAGVEGAPRAIAVFFFLKRNSELLSHNE